MAEGNDLQLIQKAVQALNHGKRLPTAIYVFDQAGESLPPELGRICVELRKRLELDERFNLLKFHTDQPKISFLSYLALSAHKLGGPKGVGALVVRKGVSFVPLLHGGHQERGRRGGTENVAGIIGFGRAAELALAELPDYAAKIAPLRDRLETGLLTRVPGTERNGHMTERLANTASLTFPGIEAEALLLLLDQAGVCASAGSACLADSDEPSHVIRAMKPQTAAARQMIRFSLGKGTPAAEVDSAVAAVAVSVGRLLR